MDAARPSSEGLAECRTLALTDSRFSRSEREADHRSAGLFLSAFTQSRHQGFCKPSEVSCSAIFDEHSRSFATATDEDQRTSPNMRFRPIAEIKPEDARVRC
jgi:hypothetical protein